MWRAASISARDLGAPHQGRAEARGIGGSAHTSPELACGLAGSSHGYGSGPIALLCERLPYHLHATFLGALATKAAGSREAADRTYAATVGPARRLLRTAGHASDADLLNQRGTSPA